MNLTSIRLALIPLLLVVPSLQAEVTRQQPGTFSIRLEAKLDSSADQAYQRFMQIHHWWNPDHTYSGMATNLSINEHCFCERWNDSLVRHLEVRQLRPGQLIRLSGGLGPLQASALTGLMDIQFKSVNDHTQVKLTYEVWSSKANQIETMAPVVNGMLTEQFDRFTTFAEGGEVRNQESS